MAESISVKAYSKGINLAPRKVSIVASLVRNRIVNDALVILDHTPRRSALQIKKAILSAQSNATNNLNADSKTLKISKILVTNGTKLKRYRPASRGRALPYEKRSSNILVIVEGLKKEVKTKKITSKSPRKEK